MIDTTRVLVLGGSGMLGHTLFEILSNAEELETHATVRSPPTVSLSEQGRGLEPRGVGKHVYSCVDAEDFATVESVVKEVGPDIVLNCIGLVKQRSESENPVAMITVNSLFPRRLARLCASRGYRMIHFSTDCVFSGAKGGYSEDDSTDPTDLYGRAKLLGEPSEPGCLTLRTSMIGHERGRRQGLLEWFLKAHERVQGFSQAVFTGLPTVEIANVLRRYVLSTPGIEGIYHLAAEPISKLRLLELIAERYGIAVEIEPVSEPRVDRSLDGSRFQALTGYRSPAWPQLIDAMYHDAEGRYCPGSLTGVPASDRLARRTTRGCDGVL